MTNRSNAVMTVAYLLALAASHIKDKTNEKTGTHPTVSQAITEAASEFKFRKDVAPRAIKLFAHLYHTDLPVPKTRSKANPKPGATFGKNQSDSQDKYAVASTLKNRDQRYDALLLASKHAEQHHSKWYK